LLQIPLVNGTSKDKPNKFDEKLLQVNKPIIHNTLVTSDSSSIFKILDR